MTTYTVASGENYPTPRITGSVGTDLQFYFSLDDTWSQLYDRTTAETQKITGISELFNANSVRLGVRRQPTMRKSGLVAVFYLHVNGKTTYNALKDADGHAIILQYYTRYFCRIWKNGAFWQLDLFTGDMKLLATASQQMNIGSFLFGRRLSSIYVEPTFPRDIRTGIEWVKG